MIQLHDRTRRRIALAIFFTFGLMPTLAVSAWGVWWRSSWCVRGEAEQLTLRLGMEVRLSAVRHPQPGVAVYEKIVVCEPETHQPVFGCEQAEIRWDKLSKESNAPGLRVIISQPELNAAQWPEIWRLAEHLIAGRAETGEVGIQLEAKQLSIAGRGISQKLAHVLVQVEPRPGGPQIQASFRLPGEESDPARILLTRNRKLTPPLTRLDIDASATPLPCPLLAIGLPGFESLGPRSWFCGTLWAACSPKGASGELAGQFAAVDMGRLTSDDAVHQLSGTVNLTIKTARFSQGRLTEAHASLTGGPGTVSRSLLEAAQRLGMTARVAADEANRHVSYEKLTVWLSCDARGLRLGGMSPSGDPGTILAGRFGPVLIESQTPDEPLPLTAVAQAVAPNAESLVPIAHKPAWLTRLPSATPRVEPDATNPLR